MVFQRSEIFLTMVIILFFLLALLFLTLLVISRLKKLRRLKKQKTYDFLTGYFLFSVIFEDKSFKELSLEKEYSAIINDSFFKSRLLDAVIKLHKSYTGEVAKKIEEFYYDSSLIKETYRKLEHGAWSVKCEAIRELAEMNVTSSYSLIANYVSASNLTLRQEAITAIIKLIGLKGLNFLNDYNELLTDWIQLNLISIIKHNFPSTDEPYYNSFIDSENASVALFGRRLKLFYEKSNDSFFETDNPNQVIYKINPDDENPIVTYFKKGSQFIKHKLTGSFFATFKRVLVLSIPLFVCCFGTHLFEILSAKISLYPLLYYAAINDLYITLLIAFITIPVFMLFHMIEEWWMRFVSFVVYLSIIFIHLALSFYFFKAKVPLGSDLLAYSMDEIKETSKAAGGFSYSTLGAFILVLLGYIFAVRFFIKSSDIFIRKIRLVILILLLLFAFSFLLRKERINTLSEYENYLAVNKSAFFISSIADNYQNKAEFPFTDEKQYYLSSSADESEQLIDPNFPFLKKNSARNTLQPFFTELTRENKPNLVFLLLEGMGSDFVGEHAKLGNFNTFLDSLSKQSLFWENALSAGGRTFAALPSIFASLPFLKQGYLEEGKNAPKTTSLFRILTCNGYTCEYYTGSNASFDKMDIFLKEQGVEIGSEQNHFGAGYSKLPSLNGFSWGYGDKDIFRNYFTLSMKTQPKVSVFFTIANHSPYVIPDQNSYIERVKKRILEINLPADKKEFLGSYLNELSCLLYSDDALRYFFKEYSKRKEFENTIFIITGDHRAPEIPISFQIDRFRVPLLIYSPLLKRSANFKSIVTHQDITPTLLALLSGVIDRPAVNSWVGTLLDTSKTVAFGRQVALMRNKNEFQDFLSNDYFLSGNNLYKLTSDLGLELVDNETKKRQLKEQFTIYKLKNQEVLLSKMLVPDSVLSCKTKADALSRLRSK